MCLMAPGRVIQLAGDVAIVDVEGRQRRASTLLQPDVVVGDWVVLAGGAVLRRVDDRTAAEMMTALATVAVQTSTGRGTRDE